MLARWNAVVTPADEVWHLGDFAVGRKVDAAGLLAALNGTKHLVTGNNDPDAVTSSPGWASVQTYAERTVDGTALVLCHYAFRSWRDMGRSGGRGTLNLHGHSHGRLSRLRRQFDVGVDVWDFRPVTLAQIIGGQGSMG